MSASYHYGADIVYSLGLLEVLPLGTDGAASVKQTCLLCRVATDEVNDKNPNQIWFFFRLLVPLHLFSDLLSK